MATDVPSIGTPTLAARLHPASATNSFRRSRMERCLAIIRTIIAEQGQCRVLDLGGTVEHWQTFAGHLPDGAEVSMVNQPSHEGYSPSVHGPYRCLVGDACAMPELADLSYDLVYSNSVIEHVGRWDRVVAMAAEARRLAPRHFIQTPNFWFPIEPHFRYPYFQLLPEPIKASMMLRKRRGFLGKAADIGVATRQAQYATLLEYRQMTFLFPDSQIVRERWMGLTKSLIAIRA